MNSENAEALALRAHAEPDVDARARMLNVDLRSVAATHRRLVVILWSTAIAVAAAVLLTRTLRIGLVAGHGHWEPWIRPYLGLVAQGALTLVVAVWVVGSLLHSLQHAVQRRGRPPRWVALVFLVLAAAVLPGIAAGLALLIRDWTFLLGVVVGTPIAIARGRYPLDIAKRLRQNNPFVVRFLADQSDLEFRNGLVQSRLRWLIVELVTAVVGATAMVLMVVVAPVSAIPLAFVDAGIGFALVATRRVGRECTGRVIDVAVTAVIVAVALLLAGGFLLPTVFFGTFVEV
jgi:hypothetical protein